MFTSLDVKRLTDAANWPGFKDKNILYPLLSKAERQSILQGNKPDLQSKQIAASVEIQRIWRGYRTRKIFSSFVNSESSFKTTPSYEITLSSKTHSTERLSPLMQKTSQVKLKYDMYTENSEEYKLLSFQSFCAYIIQKWWRDQVSKKKKLQSDAFQTAAKERKKFLSASRAAKVIQKAWRTYIDLKVFKYFKDLIDFRNKGDGKFMLRFINPKEAALMDSSIGMHVRFRLGGVTFPPSVYYKIFTSNVADVCSFSPRNYADSRESWYRRFENNSWRPVMLQCLKQNDILEETSCQKSVFSHVKLLRKQELALKRKKRKIEWMKKLYMIGVLKPKSHIDTDVHNKISQEISMTGRVDEEWEVDDLLQWTAALNYESYVEDWLYSGTSFIQENLFELHDGSSP